MALPALHAPEEPTGPHPLGFHLAPPTAPVIWEEAAATHATWLRATHALTEGEYNAFVLACERRARFWRGRLVGPVSRVSDRLSRFPALNPRRKRVRVTLGDVARTAFLYAAEWRQSSRARLAAEQMWAETWAQIEAGGPVGRLLPLVPDAWGEERW